MKLLKSLLFLSLSFVIFTGCDDDDDDDDVKTPPVSTKSDLALHFDHMFATESFNLNQNYTLAGGEIVKLSIAQFYISNVSLMDDDQNTVSFDDSYLLVDPSVVHHHIGEMEAEHYHMIMLNVGIDSATNVGKQPIDYADGHPLAAQLESMWWSWNAGYIFFKIEGQVDRDGDGTFDDNFLYHIGTNPNLIGKQEMLHSTAVAGSEFEVHMKIDYSKFFNNVDLTSELEARMMPPQIVTKMVTNANEAIGFE